MNNDTNGNKIVEFIDKIIYMFEHKFLMLFIMVMYVGTLPHLWFNMVDKYRLDIVEYDYVICQSVEVYIILNMYCDIIKSKGEVHVELYKVVLFLSCMVYRLINY